jgi:hypothetical protein
MMRKVRNKGQGKAIPGEDLRDQDVNSPRFSRKSANKSGKFVTSIHGRLYPQEIFLVLISVRG